MLLEAAGSDLGGKQWLSKQLMCQNDLLPIQQNRLLNCCRLSTPNPHFIFFHRFLYRSRDSIQLSVSFFAFIFAKITRKKNNCRPTALVWVTPSKSFKRSWYRYYFDLMTTNRNMQMRLKTAAFFIQVTQSIKQKLEDQHKRPRMVNFQLRTRNSIRAFFLPSVRHSVRWSVRP